MNLNSRMKKRLLIVCAVAAVLTIGGCTVPHDEAGNVILISQDTTFKEIFSNENWFSALFVWPLCWVLNKLTPKIGVGGAMAVVTIVVNGLLAIITFKSQIANQQMQLIQPQLQKLQRKYEGRTDRASQMKMAQEQQALMQKYNIKPGSMMLLSFIQLPIVMAMFMAIQRSESIANGTFLGMNLKTTPSQGFKLLFSGDTSGIPYIILFALMAITQVLLMKVPQWMQKKRAEEEAAKHHRKPEEANNTMAGMQTYMIVMVLMFGLMWSSGMSLYWFIRNIVDIVKTFVVQKAIDKRNAEQDKRR